MQSAREWVLAQPGGSDFDEADMAKAVAAIEERDRDVIELCAQVAEAYEPRCGDCPRGVAAAIRHRAPIR